MTEQGERRMDRSEAGRISHHTVTDHLRCFGSYSFKRQTIPKIPSALYANCEPLRERP